MNKKNLKKLGTTCIIAGILTMGISFYLLKVSDIWDFDILILDRFLLIYVGAFFCSSHVTFKVSDLYNFMFNHRYKLGIILLITIVTLNYNGSSIAAWNLYVQPNNINPDMKPIIGVERHIRSDEWLVSTPMSVTQMSTEPKGEYFNPNPRGTNTDMFIVAGAPIRSVAILGQGFKAGYLLLGTERGLSFYWFGRLIFLFLISIEFLLILTKKNKIASFVGAVMITFSMVVGWWGIIDSILFGQLAIVLAYYFLNSIEKRKKVLFSIGFAWALLNYITGVYPPIQIGLGFIFLLIGIWLIGEYHDKQLTQKKDYIILIAIVVSFLSIVLGYIFIHSKDTYKILANTVYPGARFATGGSGLYIMFTALFGTVYAYKDLPADAVGNLAENSAFLSFFPLSLVLGIYWSIRDRFKNKLLLGLNILALFYVGYIAIGFPEWLARITLLSRVPGERLSICLGLLLIYILAIIISERRKESSIYFLFFSLIVTITTAITLFYNIKVNGSYLSVAAMVGLGVVFVAMGILLVASVGTKNDHFLKLLVTVVTAISLVTTVNINPINKGTGILFEKPLAKEIVKIQKENSGKWIAINSRTLQNYILMQGVPSINSTNTYPNLELWRKLDTHRKYDEVYNRYAHVIIYLVNEETKFLFAGEDAFDLKLNIKDLKKINIKYVVSPSEIVEINTQEISMRNIYVEDGIWIYEVQYK